MPKGSLPALNKKRKRPYSEADAGVEPPVAAAGSPSLKKSVLRAQQKLLSAAPDQTENGALKEWEFAINAEAVSSTSKSKSTSNQVENETRRVNARDFEYLDNLRRRDIYIRPAYTTRHGLTNLQELEKTLSLPRPSNSSDQVDGDNFRTRLSRCKTLATVHDTFSDIFPMKNIGSSDFFMSQSKQQWFDWIPPCPDQRPRLEAPEPDYAVGLRNSDSYPNSIASYATPGIREMAWILLVVEYAAEGRYKNILNGAVAVNNILQLKKAIGREDGFYGTGSVFSIEFNVTCIYVNVHWVTRADDHDSFHHFQIGYFVLLRGDTKTFVEARNWFRNLMDWLEHDVGKQLVEEVKAFHAQNSKARGKSSASRICE
ncbi:hypothetical protein MMC30_004220 [Trapelia coarctata]|nr:hypothetical protein [Trapelia coarctata]